jgi:hypothetical protein
MLHYVYYPYPEGSATGANGATLKRYSDKYSSSLNNTHDEKAAGRNVLIYKPQNTPANPSAGPLDCVRDDDMLLIGSHGGSTDSTVIQSDQGTKLTHTALATQLFRNGS